MDDIDIVDICTPPVLHYPHGRWRRSRAGKHVVCEKPLVGSLAEVDALDRGRARGRAGALMPIFQYRFGDGVQKAKRIIERGLAGKPYLATVETAWQRGAEYYAVPWRGKWETELGGVLLTHAIHAHDMLTYPDGRRRLGVRPHGDAGQRDRGRGLRSVSLAMAVGRARDARRDARLAAGDQPPALLLRARDLRELARRLYRRATIPGRSFRPTTRSRSAHRRRARGLDAACRRASTA